MGVFSFSGVLDVSDVARVTVNVVVDSLAATIGQVNEVGSLGVVSVAVLVVTEVDVAVVVLDSVVKVVLSRGLMEISKSHFVLLFSQI